MTDEELKFIEQKLTEEFAQIKAKPFDEKFEEIKDKLGFDPFAVEPVSVETAPVKVLPKRRIFNKKTIISTISTLVACLVLVFVPLGIHWHLNDPNRIGGGNNNVITESDVVFAEIDPSLLFGLDMFVPNLIILNDVSVVLGELITYDEVVLFRVTGQHYLGNVRLNIITHPKFQTEYENYFRDDNLINIEGKEVSVHREILLSGGYRYRLGFLEDDFRYQITFDTTQSNSYLEFLNQFLL
ncbi:MAG: hypothetical protein FWC11_05780 [Firmicutes bacterium]|nr:hypothetical protein [Bacillota bacterium]